MTDPVYIALIAAVPPTLVALGAFIVGIINSIKANKIHVLVNSNLSAVKTDLAIANERIVGLQALLTTTPTTPVV